MAMRIGAPVPFVALTHSSPLSGVASTSVPSPLSLTAEGASVNGSVIVTDVAGNSATIPSPSVKIDKTPPTLTFAAATPAANAAGWNNGNVTVALSASDNASGSGVRSITYAIGAGAATTVNGASASLALSSEGVTSVRYFATDNVGNTESAKTLTVRIDRTPPAATLSLSPDRIWPPNHKFVSVYSRFVKDHKRLFSICRVRALIIKKQGIGDSVAFPKYVERNQTI